MYNGNAISDSGCLPCRDVVAASPHHPVQVVSIKEPLLEPATKAAIKMCSDVRPGVDDDRAIVSKSGSQCPRDTQHCISTVALEVAVLFSI